MKTPTVVLLFVGVLMFASCQSDRPHNSFRDDKTVSGFTSSVERYERELGELKNEVKEGRELRSSVRDQEKEIAALRGEAKEGRDLQASIKGQEKEIVALRAEVKEVRELLSSVKGQEKEIAVLRDEVKAGRELAASVKTQERGIDALRDEVKKENGLRASVEKQEKDVANLKDSVNLALAEQGKYISFLSYLTAGIIGCVTIVFGAGVFCVYKENQYLIKKAEDELQGLKTLKANFEEWFRGQDKEIKRVFALELKAYQRETENLNNFNYLKVLLDEPPIENAAVYSHLTPLIADPKLIYRALFTKIVKLGLNSEITAKAQEGIEAIKKLTKGRGEKPD